LEFLNHLIVSPLRVKEAHLAKGQPLIVIPQELSQPGDCAKGGFGGLIDLRCGLVIPPSEGPVAFFDLEKPPGIGDQPCGENKDEKQKERPDKFLH
jgi:hypothetical protein